MDMRSIVRETHLFTSTSSPNKIGGGRVDREDRHKAGRDGRQAQHDSRRRRRRTHRVMGVTTEQASKSKPSKQASCAHTGQVRAGESVEQLR